MGTNHLITKFVRVARMLGHKMADGREVYVRTDRDMLRVFERQGDLWYDRADPPEGRHVTDVGSLRDVIRVPDL